MLAISTHRLFQNVVPTACVALSASTSYFMEER
jgi:hypothetical protein